VFLPVFLFTKLLLIPHQKHPYFPGILYGVFPEELFLPIVKNSKLMACFGDELFLTYVKSIVYLNNNMYI